MTALRLPADPRLFQIAVLSGLLIYGLSALDLALDPTTALVILLTAETTQWLASRWVGCRFDPRSPLISALSLCLLLRTATPVWGMVAAVVAIGGKFVIRVRGKHVFNPANLGLVVTMVLTDAAWVSPGQWGTVMTVAVSLVLLGMLVTRRAERDDVTWAFLVAWATLLGTRAWWLGDPLSIPLHQLQNGALLIFAFFMISDPKTTPDHRAGRVVYAVWVATLGAVLEFVFFVPAALIWALALSAPIVPLLDLWLPALRYRWPSFSSSSTRSTRSVMEAV